MKILTFIKKIFKRKKKDKREKFHPDDLYKMYHSDGNQTKEFIKTRQIICGSRCGRH